MSVPPEDALQALLDAERETLLSGDLTRMRDVCERKIVLARAVADRADTIARARLDALAETARHNARLCEAARNGLREAIDRISERARVAGGLETYAPDGRRRSDRPGPRRLEKRS